jgi:iron complex outermembrane recepter protein
MSFQTPSSAASHLVDGPRQSGSFLQAARGPIQTARGPIQTARGPIRTARGLNVFVGLPVLLVLLAAHPTEALAASQAGSNAPPSEIHGIVVDGRVDDRPIEGARVHLPELGRETRSLADGSFSFADVPAGLWELHARAEGFRPVTVHVTVDAEAPATVTVTVRLLERIVILEDVVASVSPLSNPIGYQPAQALDRDELARRLDASIGVMLDGEPGVAMRSLGPAPGRPVIRGFDGDRVLVLEDGQRMGDLSESAADHALALDPTAVDRIEIVRGPASLLYGSSALGGIVNLMTEDLPARWTPGWSGAMTSQAASVNRSTTGAGAVRYGSERWAMTGRLSLREAGDLRTPEARLPGTAISSLDGQLGGVRRKGPLRLGLSSSFVFREYGIPEGLDDELEEVRIQMERQALRGELSWTASDGAFVEGLAVRAGAQRFYQEEIEREFGVGDEIELEFLQHHAQLTATLRHRGVGPIDAGAIGLAVRGRDLTVGGVEAFTPGIREGSTGLFAFEEVPLGEALRLQVGVRGELNISRARPNSAFPAISDRRRSLATSGSIGLNWRPATHWEAGFQLARAHRTPTLEELHADGPHLGAGTYEIGTPDLRDEVGHGADLFVRRSGPRLSLELAGFTNVLSGFVAFEPTGQIDEGSGLPVFRYRSTAARMTGGEVTLTARPADGLTLRAGLDYVRGDEQVVDGPDRPLPVIPPLRARLETRFDFGRVWVATTLRAVRSQRRVAPAEEPTPGYLLLGGDVGMNLGALRTHMVMIRIENATNRLYRDHLSRVEERGYPMPGRGVTATYRLRF